MKQFIVIAMFTLFIISCNNSSDHNDAVNSDSSTNTKSGVGIDTMPGKNSAPINPDKIMDTGKAVPSVDSAGKEKPDNP